MEVIQIQQRLEATTNSLLVSSRVAQPRGSRGNAGALWLLDPSLAIEISNPTIW
jgi:hypothetical protein